MSRIIEVWDYWIDYETRIAYCIGIIDGTLYLAQGFVQFMPPKENNEGEEWKK